MSVEGEPSRTRPERRRRAIKDKAAKLLDWMEDPIQIISDKIEIANSI